MECVLLLASIEGLAGSFALEWPNLRWPLRDPVTGTGCTQMVLRLRYEPSGPGTPRCPVPEVLGIQFRRDQLFPETQDGPDGPKAGPVAPLRPCPWRRHPGYGKRHGFRVCRAWNNPSSPRTR